jgi:ferrous iron transport protein B
MKAGPLIAVAGNPNVGKTSLFNVLTGSRHHVGNYSGVTVERVEGALASRFGEPRVRLVDLPGMYSLTAGSEDEAVAFRTLTGDGEPAPDGVLLVLDASNLARNLYLALQILELGLPTVVALNMVDVAAGADLPIDTEALARQLGVPVVATNARRAEGGEAIAAALHDLPPRHERAPLGEETGELGEVLAAMPAGTSPSRARWLVTTGAAGQLDVARASERAALADVAATTWIAAAQQLVVARYAEVDRILETIGHRAKVVDAAPTMNASARIDAVLTHRLWGLLAFVGVMGLIFISIFAWADPVMGVIEDVMGVLSSAVADALGPGLLTELLTDGVIAGVGNVVVFVPQIALLFLFLGLLEDTGYLARAAFLLDRVMSRLGLHGRAFIPLLSGYACAIPAIMGTRTISSVKDRMVTILMIPFMSCSARLPIYTLVIGALFVSGHPVVGGGVDRGLVLLGMYLLSTVSALAMGFVYKRTILRSPTPPLVLELPPYRMPRISNTLVMTWDRVKDFLRSAGTVIMACTIVLWAVLSFPREDTHAGGEGPTLVADSWGGRVARTLEPALEPIGQDWRIGVGLIGSFAAREVLVSTLGLVYGLEAEDDDPVQLREALRDAKNDDGSPRYTALSGLALMVFFVYACQCMSTLAVVRRETGTWRWPAFMFGSMTLIAYVAALIVYQGGRALGYG